MSKQPNTNKINIFKPAIIKNKKSKTNKNKKISNDKIKNQVAKAFKSLNINKNLIKTTTISNNYLKALLLPEYVENARIPGDPYTSTSFHKTALFTINTANAASGAVSFIYDPAFLYSSTSSTGSCMLSVGTTAVPFTGSNITAGSYYAVNPFGSAFTAGVYSSYRLVACSVTVNCNSSLYNMGGEMYLSLLPSGNFSPGSLAINAANGLAGTGFTINTLANSTNLATQPKGRMKRFCLGATPSARVIWAPADRSDYLPRLQDGVSPVSDAADNIIVITCVSTVASQSYEFKIDAHYELAAAQGSLNVALDSICKDDHDPLVTAKTLLTDYSDYIVTDAQAQHYTTMQSGVNQRLAPQRRKPLMNPQLYQNAIAQEFPDEVSSQYHVPGYNYLGPGTHILENILKGVEPVNAIDQAAYWHDINYLASTSDEMRDRADDIAIKQFNIVGGPIGHISALGLNLNKVLRRFGLDFGKN